MISATSWSAASRASCASLSDPACSSSSLLCDSSAVLCACSAAAVDVSSAARAAAVTAMASPRSLSSCVRVHAAELLQAYARGLLHCRVCQPRVCTVLCDTAVPELHTCLAHGVPLTVHVFPAAPLQLTDKATHLVHVRRQLRELALQLGHGLGGASL